MAIPAGYLASLLTPMTPVGSAPIGAGARLGQLGENMRSNRAQEGQSQQRLDMSREAFDFERQQAEQQQKQKALATLHQALQDPDDWSTLQFAVSQARSAGIDVSGLDNWRPHRPENEGPLGEAVPVTPEQAGEKAHEGLRKNAATPVAPSPPDWLNQYMAQETGQVPEPQPVPAPEWLQGYMEKEQAVPPGPEAEPISFEVAEKMSAAASIPDPQGVKAMPPGAPPGMGGDPMGQIAAGIPGEADDDIVISMDGQQVARIGAGDVVAFREKQASKVAQVFEPFKQNARTPSEQRAATMGQEAARKAASSGLSRKEAVLFGAEVYNRALGRDDAAEALRLKAKAFGKGGGGGMSTSEARERSADRQDRKELTEAEHKIITRHVSAHGVEKTRDLIEKSRRGVAGLNSKNVIEQNTAVTTWVHSLAGSAQTKQEIEGLTGGLSIWSKIEALKQRSLGGERPAQLRAELKQVLLAIISGSAQKLKKAGESARKAAIRNGIDEDRAAGVYEEIAGMPYVPPKKPKEKSADEEAADLLRKAQ